MLDSKTNGAIAVALGALTLPQAVSASDTVQPSPEPRSVSHEPGTSAPLAPSLPPFDAVAFLQESVGSTPEKSGRTLEGLKVGDDIVIRSKSGKEEVRAIEEPRSIAGGPRSYLFHDSSNHVVGTVEQSAPDGPITLKARPSFEGTFATVAAHAVARDSEPEAKPRAKGADPEQKKPAPSTPSKLENVEVGQTVTFRLPDGKTDTRQIHPLGQSRYGLPGLGQIEVGANGRLTITPAEGVTVSLEDGGSAVGISRPDSSSPGSRVVKRNPNFGPEKGGNVDLSFEGKKYHLQDYSDAYRDRVLAEIKANPDVTFVLTLSAHDCIHCPAQAKNLEDASRSFSANDVRVRILRWQEMEGDGASSGVQGWPFTIILAGGAQPGAPRNPDQGTPFEALALSRVAKGADAHPFFTGKRDPYTLVQLIQPHVSDDNRLSRLP